MCVDVAVLRNYLRANKKKIGYLDKCVTNGENVDNVLNVKLFIKINKIKQKHEYIIIVNYLHFFFVSFIYFIYI